MAEGEEKMSFVFVRNALRKGLSLPEISELTGLPKNKVKRMAAEESLALK